MQDQGCSVVAYDDPEDNLVGAVVPELQAGLNSLVRAGAQLPQVQVPVEQCMLAGAYLRGGWVPAGTVIVGKRLRREVPLILLQGSMRVVLDETVSDVQAPWMGSSQQGTRRAFVTLTDCFLINAAIMPPGTKVEEAESLLTMEEQVCSSA